MAPQNVIKEVKSRMTKHEKIVISGMSGIYPQSINVKEFSELLYDKVNPITSEGKRWNYNHPEVSQFTGNVSELNRFDAQFFRVHQSLGHNMDPMSRKMLEHTYQAIYDAGLSPQHLFGKKIGVFIGTCFSETEKMGFYMATTARGLGLVGCCKAMYANRISFWLNTKGPSVGIDVSCCSSTAALEQAYHAIMLGDCEAAIIGGASLCLHPQSSVHYSRVMKQNPDGKMKSFDEDADGCVRSEAVVVMFLQKAKDAKRVYAEVIHVKSQFTPLRGKDGPFFGFYRDPLTIEKFYNEFYDEAGVSPQTVEYVEAFGSAVPEADKAELEVLSKVFCRDRDDPLYVGSVMSNIGYTEAATGISAISKVLLGYHQGRLAANLHCEKPRSDVPALQDGRMCIVKEHQPFNRGYTAVNSLAITGSNIHVLLHGCYKPKDKNRYKSVIPHLVTISGRYDEAVQSILDDLKSRPIDPEEIALFHNIHKMNINGHLGRGFTILDTNSEQKTVSLVEKCEYFDTAKKPLWFVYSGMGSQWAGMGAQLMRIPIFAAAIQRCHQALEPKGVDLTYVVTSEDKTIFDNILNSFIGIAAIQIGLTDVLKELGLVPDFIIGHSVGELGCAYADGCFTAEEMILSAYSRGLISIQTPFIRGSMAAVGIGNQQIVSMIPPEIQVACHNSSESSTISGPADIMREFVSSLTAKGIFAKEVPCSNIAYHSRYIADAGPGLLKYLSEVIKDPKPRSERWLSTSVPQDRWDEPHAKYSSAEYHTNNLLNPVLFEETSRLIPSNAVLVEVAPHGLLQAILKRSLPPTCCNIPLTRRGHPNNPLLLLEGVGKLYMEGYYPKVDVLYPKVEFPVSTGTPQMSHLVKWAHQQKWSLPLFVSARKRFAAASKLIVTLHDDEHVYLRGNNIRGRTVFPFAGALVAVWDTLAMCVGAEKKKISVEFSDVHLFVQPILNKELPLKLNLALHRGTGWFEIMDGNSKVASGFVVVRSGHIVSDIKQDKNIGTDLILSSEDIYQILYEREYSYNGCFQSIQGANADLTKANIEWNNNWVTFIDGVLQLNALRQKHDGVSQPVHFRHMAINVNEHSLANVINCNGKDTMEASVQDMFNRTRCGGVVFDHLKFSNIAPLGSSEILLSCISSGEINGSLAQEQPVNMETNLSLQSKRVGDIDSVSWVEQPLPAASGLTVKVHYAGLNTVDAKRASGVYPVKKGDLINGYGMDFSGITNSGERVMGIVSSGAASERVQAIPELLWPVPQHWTLEDAATVPLAYAHAYYCLAIKSQLQPNNNILVHGGTGALGQAAISIALAHGLEVFTTVSSISKKHFLRKLFPQLQEDHIGNSRENSFLDMVRSLTKGAGCSYVLNCIEGDLKNESIDCCGSSGMVLDTVRIVSNEKYDYGMYYLSADRNYVTVDFSSIFKNSDKLDMIKLQLLVSSGIERGYVRPLSRVVYPPASAARALRLLAASRHRGRVLLQLADSTPAPAVPSFAVTSDHCHVVLCDNESQGLQIGKGLVNRGVKKLFLHLPSVSDSMPQLIKQFVENKVEVKISTVSLNSTENVNGLLEEARRLGPIQGIYLVKMSDIANANQKKILTEVDYLSRKLCGSLEYFAVVSPDKEFGNTICVSRKQEQLPATKLIIPKFGKMGRTDDFKKSMTWRSALDALGMAVQTSYPVVAAQIKRKNTSLLQKIAGVSGIAIGEKVPNTATLQSIGVSLDKAPAIAVLLRDEYHVSYTEDYIMTLNIQQIHEIDQNINGTMFKEVKGLDVFFSYVTTDELIATTEMVFLPTLTADVSMADDEIDMNQISCMIIPGLEGNYNRFKELCERIKMPALVLQPKLDYPDKSVVEIAQEYAEVILKRININEKFYLLGYESGIMAALELASILEGHGYTGIVFCIGAAPEEFKSFLKHQLREYTSDSALEDAIIHHTVSLMDSTCEIEFNESTTWQEKVEICARTLVRRVPFSAQYVRAQLEATRASLLRTMRYEALIPTLRSRLVLLRPADCNPTSSDRNPSSPEPLQQYSLQPVVVHDLKAPLASSLSDLRCASIINRHLDSDVLKEFDTKNLCETYLINAISFRTESTV